MFEKRPGIKILLSRTYHFHLSGLAFEEKTKYFSLEMHQMWHKSFGMTILTRKFNKIFLLKLSLVKFDAFSKNRRWEAKVLNNYLTKGEIMVSNHLTLFLLYFNSIKYKIKQLFLSMHIQNMHAREIRLLFLLSTIFFMYKWVS